MARTLVSFTYKRWTGILKASFRGANLHYMNDVLLDKNNDLKIVNGDLVIGDATLQHQNHIITANKGEFKEFPEVGVGLSNAILDENPRAILNTIKRQLEHDGMEVKELKINASGEIVLNAKYK